jgi:outer membrane protein OmpA-like peptidoglycan-associated protein
VKVQAGAGANSEDDAANTAATATAASSAPAPAETGSADAASTASAPAEATPTATATADPEPAPPAAEPIVRKGAKINLPAALIFEAGSAALSDDPSNQQLLEQLLAFLKKNAAVTKMRIEGHTDPSGDEAANLKLSGERALTVKQWLIGKGIKTDRLIATGFGGKKPIADGTTAEGKAQNERLQFRVATLNGRRYLGLELLGGGTEFK